VDDLLPAHLYAYRPIPREAVPRDRRRYHQAFPGLTLIAPSAA
jgi:hypothetical protein